MIYVLIGARTFDALRWTIPPHCIASTSAESSWREMVVPIPSRAQVQSVVLLAHLSGRKMTSIALDDATLEVLRVPSARALS